MLIATANFAPRGASPVIRSVHLVKYLEQIGCRIEVVTYDEATLTIFSPEDPGLASKVPASVGIYRTGPGPLRAWLVRRRRAGSGSVSGWRSSLRNPAIHLLWPDPHAEAVPLFARRANARCSEFRPNVVLTHAYPFSMHLVGRMLARHVTKPAWIADYGDPWSGGGVAELERPTWRRRLDQMAERRVLAKAGAITLTTEATRSLYAGMFPEMAPRMMVVPMGYDPEEFSHVTVSARPDAEKERVWLVHTGRLYREARDPEPFLSALDEVTRQDPARADRLRVFLVGEVDEVTRKRIKASPASSIVREVPWVPYAESLRWMLAADELLLFGNKGELQIPGKLYNYIGSGTPILMLCETERDPGAQLLRDLPGAKLLPNSPRPIAEYLRELLKRGRRMGPRRPMAGAEAFAWPNIARALLTRMEALVAEKRA